MRILIHGLNYTPEPTGIGLYTGGLAQSLAQLGHDVRVICAVPHYPQWELFEGYRQSWSRRREQGVDVLRCPVYIPSGASGIKRILHYFSFLFASLAPVLIAALRFRPELVLAVAPSLIAAGGSLVAARLCGATSQLHIQDFEVEAAFATANLSSKGLAAGLARWFERKIMSSFDTVSTISPEMAGKLRDKGVAAKNILELRNWAEIEAIQPQASSRFRGEWGIGERMVALYSGSIARKQGIESIIDAARLMQERQDLVFVICGSGPRRKDLERFAAGLPNVQVRDLQPMENLNELLNLATIHLLPQKRDAADLVLPSKLANMLASGRPVVAGADPGTGIAREVEGAGVICTPESGAAMAAAIAGLLDDALSREALGREARRRARERWARDQIIGRFDEQLRARGSASIGGAVVEGAD